jgi:DNA polymerase-1
VRGIGEKGAAKLLADYGTLDNIYANLDAIRPERTRLALEAGRDMAHLSRRLAALEDDVPGITFEPLRCALQYDYSEVETLWDDLGFENLRKRAPQNQGQTP